MMISENSYTINQHGNLKIPSRELIAMGLFAGMHVRVAFLSEDGEKNTFHEFLLTKNSFTEFDAEPRFQIPADLLRQAKIAEDADIQMIVVDGAILICQEPNLTVQELKAISDSLGLAASMTEELPDDLPAAKDRLQQALSDFMDEEMSSNEYDTGRGDTGEGNHRSCD